MTPLDTAYMLLQSPGCTNQGHRPQEQHRERHSNDRLGTGYTQWSPRTRKCQRRRQQGMTQQMGIDSQQDTADS